MILIDVDGTLVDSVPDLAYCVDEMMKQLGREPWGETRVRDWVGNGVERLVRRVVTGRELIIRALTYDTKAPTAVADEVMAPPPASGAATN